MAASRAKGAMAAVLGLADEEVERLCAEAGDVWPANYNCPGQLVISGRENGVAAVGDKARDLGAKVVRLRVSGAFHSPLVEDAAQRLEPGKLVLLTGMGAGLTWGSALIDWTHKTTGAAA
jgi:[acyl-carrier-protein] S-malonyltransferase